MVLSIRKLNNTIALRLRPMYYGHYTEVVLKLRFLCKCIPLKPRYTLLMPPKPINTEIVSALYNIALQPKRWPEVLDRLHPIVGAKAAGLAVIEKTQMADETEHHFAIASTSINSEDMAVYNQNFAQYEQVYAHSIFNSVPGTIVIDKDFENRDQIIQRPDVDFCINTLGILDRFSVRLNDDEAWGDCIAFQYAPDRENVTADEFASLVPYLPHLAQTVSLGRMYSSIRRRYQAVLTVLNKINIGILIIRKDNTVILCNDRGKELIQINPHISISSNQKLYAVDKNMQHKVVAAINEIAETASGQGLNARSYVSLGSDMSKNNLLIEFAPLIDSESELETGFEGVLAILIDPNQHYQLKPDILGALYNLTPTENAVANLLSEGNSYEVVAESRNVARDTIKSQVSSIYRKMNTDSRAGFFRRLKSISLPFKD